MFMRHCAGTTRLELRTATGPDRGGLLAPFARSKPVAELLEWPVTAEFYACVVMTCMPPPSVRCSVERSIQHAVVACVFAAVYPCDVSDAACCVCACVPNMPPLLLSQLLQLKARNNSVRMFWVEEKGCSLAGMAALFRLPLPCLPSQRHPPRLPVCVIRVIPMQVQRVLLPQPHSQHHHHHRQCGRCVDPALHLPRVRGRTFLCSGGSRGRPVLCGTAGSCACHINQVPFHVALLWLGRSVLCGCHGRAGLSMFGWSCACTLQHPQSLTQVAHVCERPPPLVSHPSALAAHDVGVGPCVSVCCICEASAGHD